MSHDQLQPRRQASKALKPSSLLTGALCFFALTMFTHVGVQAQTLYRSVGPDGRVTFSDKPPAASAKVTPLSADGKESGASGSALPFELRQVTSKYPVTLYTSKECMPCDEGRTFLRSRGIPFSEKTVSTTEDVDALKRLADTTSLPLLTVGVQQIKGYAASEWAQYLNIAGYPEKSKLPASYKNAEPSPLVAVKPVDATASRANAAEAQPKASAPAPTPAPVPRVSPTNPAGIQF